MIAVLAAAMYTISPIELSIGKTLAVSPTQAQERVEPTPYRRPTTLAMNRAGAIAVVADDEIVIQRPNGTSTTLPYPSDDVLRKVFLSYRQVQVPPKHQTIRNVAIADDGTPFLALTSMVNGAAFSIQEASFIWQGAGWRSVLSTPLRDQLTNISVVAATAPTRWLALRDYLFLRPDEIESAHGNTANEVIVFDGEKKVLLGHGTPTCLRASYAVGYDFGFKVPGLAANAIPPVKALLWDNGHQHLLGAGIAWSVDGRGDVVGDDRPAINEPGRPVLWRGGKRIELDAKLGSAFAISDSGTIVGSVGDSAFIANADDAIPRARRLDSLINAPGWHIRAAYAVSSRGKILAIAAHNGSNDIAVELQPQQ